MRKCYAVLHCVPAHTPSCYNPTPLTLVTTRSSSSSSSSRPIHWRMLSAFSAAEMGPRAMERS